MDVMHPYAHSQGTWWSVMAEKLHFAAMKRPVTFRSEWNFGGVISHNRRLSWQRWRFGAVCCLACWWCLAKETLPFRFCLPNPRALFWAVQPNRIKPDTFQLYFFIKINIKQWFRFLPKLLKHVGLQLSLFFTHL